MNFTQAGDILNFLQAASGVIAAGIATIVVLWKFSGWTQTLIQRERDTTEALKILATSLDEVKIETQGLAIDVDRLRADMRVSENSRMRIEGRLDQVTVAMNDLTKGFAEANGSLKALWTTLQVLHPDHVPRRASDRG